jgi:hypothetical protein
MYHVNTRIFDAGARASSRRTTVTSMLAALAGGSLAGIGRGAAAQVETKYDGDFHVDSTHEVTRAADQGCNDPNGPSGGVCTTKFGGRAEVSPRIGKVRYKSTFTSDWSQAVEENSLFCAPVTGTVKLSKKGRARLVLRIKGNVCESNPTTGYPLVLDGTYKVTDSRGRYEGASGEGTASGSVAGAGEGSAATFEADGEIKY